MILMIPTKNMAKINSMIIFIRTLGNNIVVKLAQSFIVNSTQIGTKLSGGESLDFIVNQSLFIKIIYSALSYNTCIYYRDYLAPFTDALSLELSIVPLSNFNL